MPETEINNSETLSLYRSLSKAREFLEDGHLNIRCNSFRFMNDPRERCAWRFRTHDNIPNNIMEIESEFANFIKERIGLLCFAMDHPQVRDLEMNRSNADYYYGYHRPRMWAQYADNHQGVCLVFNREKLIQCMEETLEPFGNLYHGQIDYFDGTSTPQYLHGEIEDDVTDLLVEHRFDELEQQMFQNNDRIQAYFFRKHSDWRDEAEYRFVFQNHKTDRQEFQIPCIESLDKVILGYACPNLIFPSEYIIPCKEEVERCRRLREYNSLIQNIGDLSIEKMRWTNGYPGKDPIFRLGPL